MRGYSGQALLSARNISGGILRAISFDLEEGACLAICGPSGSGKTTLLNSIAGIREHSGDIFYKGRNINGLRPWQRPFRYLSQRLYLFPYLTIEGNLRLAQFAARQKRQNCRRAEMLESMGIAHLAKKYPAQVSGGEQQRAALARALIGAPQLLLLDEPFSSLDWELREKLWIALLEVKRRLAFSVLLVSHEPREAAALAGGRLRLENGIRIE